MYEDAKWNARWNESSYMTSCLLLIVTTWLESTVWRYSCLKILWPWFDLWRSSKVKGHEGKWKFTYDFLSVVYSNYMARKHRFEDTAVWKYHDLDLTFQGHPRSKVMGGNERSHMTSLMLLIVTTWLGRTVLKIQLFENTGIMTLIWPFKVIKGQRSWEEMKAHIWLPISWKL